MPDQGNRPRRIFLRARAALAVAIGLAAPTFGRAAPLDAYGRLPSLETVRISPDGAMLASVSTTGELRSVVVRPVDQAEATLRLNFGEVKLRDILWAGPKHVIAIASETGIPQDVEAPRNELVQALDINWPRKVYRPLLFGVPDTLNVIFGEPEIRFLDGKPFAYVRGVQFVRNHGRISLFRVDMEAGLTAIMSQGMFDTTSFTVDARGTPIARTEYDAIKSRWSLDLWNGEWREVNHVDAPIETPRLLGLGRDGRAIAIVGEDGDWATVREASVEPGAAATTFEIADADGLIWDPATYRLIGDAALVGDEGRYTFYDPKDQAAWSTAASQFPGARVAWESFTDDHRLWVVRVDTGADAPFHALVDVVAKTVKPLGSAYDGLKPSDIAPSRAVAFKAADGLALTGYLTLPRDKAEKGLPLVVLPHGGPASRDTPGFDWWAQALASRGYAVLRVNFRGSGDLSKALLEAGFGQWGRKMQTDLSDGVRHLATQGLADPARVCIVGASYGGYAALAGATLDTGVYRCAASIAGPSDLPAMVAQQKNRRGDQGMQSERYWLRFMGSAEGLADISPARHADKVSIPILLIHGKDDTVVPFEQTRIMADALTKAGKPFTLVTLNKEDHWLSRSATRLQMLQAVVAFLEKNNPPS